MLSPIINYLPEYHNQNNQSSVGKKLSWQEKLRTSPQLTVVWKTSALDCVFQYKQFCTS